MDLNHTCNSVGLFNDISVYAYKYFLNNLGNLSYEFHTENEIAPFMWQHEI